MCLRTIKSFVISHAANGSNEQTATFERISAFASNFPAVRSSRSAIYFSSRLTRTNVFSFSGVLCVPAHSQVLTSPLSIPVPLIGMNHNSSSIIGFGATQKTV